MYTQYSSLLNNLSLATIFILGFTIFSCSNSTKEINEQNQDSLETATNEKEEIIEVKIQYPERLEQIGDTLQKINLPLRLDSNFVSKPRRYRAIDNVTISELSINFTSKNEHDNWLISEVLKINSLKQSKKYKNYVSKLDIGQMKDASAYILNQITFKDTAVILWAINYSSYEACPFYAGSEFYASLIHQGKVLKSFKVAKYEGAGDAPVHCETFETAVLTPDHKFKLNRNSKCFEEEELIDQAQSKEVIDLKK